MHPRSQIDWSKGEDTIIEEVKRLETEKAKIYGLHWALFQNDYKQKRILQLQGLLGTQAYIPEKAK